MVILAAASAFAAPNPAIAPASPTVSAGETVQFSTPTAPVRWLADGAAGGNASVGFITAGGLYTAPANPPASGSVRITAQSANGADLAKTIVYILGPGPTITRVSQNPGSPGTFIVTVQGSGIRPGAVVFAGSVRLMTIQAGWSGITATGYGESGVSAPFCVKNPGTTCGNSLFPAAPVRVSDARSRP